MSTNRVNNTIVFDLPDKSRLHLRLANAWTRSVGIGPDVNVATCSYNEWESVGDTSKLIGDVKFFYSSAQNAGTNTADVVLNTQQIIDVQPESYGQRADPSQPPPSNTASLPVQIIAYRITFADIRHKFAHPFGGRVSLGEMNKTPLTVGGNNDANGHALFNPQQMAKECLTRMGLPGTNAVNTLSDQPRLYDVDWRGNHAPTELEKVLTHSQHTMAVSGSGQVSIHFLGTGAAPVIPTNRAIAVLPYQAIERRGRSVVFTSAPNAILETKTIQGPYDTDGDESWEWVIQDKSGAWKPYYDSGFFTSNTDAVNQLKDRLTKIDPASFNLVLGQLFRCIRLKTDKYGPSPLNRTMLTDDQGRPTDISVTAKIATLDANGVYSNSKDFVSLRVLNLYDEGRVIMTFESLLQVDGPVAGVLTDHAKQIGNNDLKVRCTREVYEKDDVQRWVPKYFEVGYKQNLGGAVEVTGTALQNLIDSGDAPLYRIPSLRLLRVDGNPVNESRLKSQTYNQAATMLSGSGDPAKRIIASGFLAGDLNGVVHKIEYHQDKPHTVFHVGTFFLASSEALPRYQSIDAQGKTEKFPQQEQVAGVRTSAGMSGFTQQSVPVQSWPPDAPPPGLVKVKITDISSAGRGKYNGGIVGGASTADESSALTEPEGMTDPTKTNVLICNLAEDSGLIQSGGPDHQLPRGYYIGKVVGGGTNGTTVEIDCDRCAEPDNPFDLQAPGASETAYGDSYNYVARNTVTLWVQTRTVYNAAGDKAEYVFHRKLTIACGKITKISSELRSTVFTTGACA